ncbi:P-loop containing nucleoside triphosphate hydrolase protein [Ilyonectria robusta]|uniref:P-loop containing nucleoside triphosphate hydrolase protein n=1 Tax=Ilyonectria robusta TaxID=1079257 RepID=UPI001E8E983D|nr:P-loop containing nucleoside triphosphate hydrolase protein [Ilyonectria robusta]KAH8686356.1 P-loop containing nucleoside triphosphate hydrolase protein [Ilyonectria robusta]
MTDVSLDSEALGQLSRDQKVLLDCIDSLRSLGVGKLVNLPQIIVVGDQSSGKSSVLEAISRVRFPVKGGLCTRFATELVLRKKPKEELVVKIRASNPDRQPDFNERRFSKHDLPEIIEQAKKLMGIGDDASSFSEDTLRVEVSGPDLEPLTLVDLPGFYHAGTSDQSPEGISTVLRLVERYMKQKNSIILAVVSAKNEIVQQKVLGEVQRHDPLRERTMGIVTKPDTLTPGSLEEEKYVQLAKNQESSHIFKHGWHVLRNRDGQESDERNAGAERTSNESRDNAEKKFFDSGVWANYSSNNKGVGSLRHKLSKVLTKHIHLSLPGVIEDIENKLEAQQERLQSLGKARSNTLEIRQYLVDIAERVRDLTRIAVRGTYDGKFFTDLHMNDLEQGQISSDQRKLRAVIRNLNRAFDTVISVRGSKMRIVGNDDIQFGNEQDRTVSESLRGWVDQFQVEEPVTVSWTDLRARLELQASNNQGTQFPGSANDRLALELFREQSQRWKDIAKTYIELAIDAAKAFVELILQHVILADENTRDAIFAEYVVPFFDERSSALEEKLDELLIHYQEGDAVCLEEEFRLRLSFQTKPRLGNQVQQLLLSDRPNSVGEITAADVKEAIANAPDGQVSEFGLEGVFDMMITYYEMSLRTFTDNVMILAVENCLISKMSTLFTPMMVLGMDDETLSRLAAESSEIRCERSDLENDIAVLKSGLAICKKYQPRKSTGYSDTFGNPEYSHDTRCAETSFHSAKRFIGCCST